MRSACIEKGIWTSCKPLKRLKGSRSSQIVWEWYNIIQNIVKRRNLIKLSDYGKGNEILYLQAAVAHDRNWTW